LGYFWHRFLFSAQVTWTMSLLFVLPHVTGVTVTQYHIIGEMGGSWIFCPGGPQIVILLISAAQAVRITDLSHRVWPYFL
jgi:hypothetical protein